jgi:glycosyltransferase involved in cell wall biosynthesis
MSSEPLKRITPVVLTYNEEENIARCLDSLTWAETVVVLDSGSTDRTEEIAKGFANVRWCVRLFDSHQQQWDHAIHSTAIQTDYVLALDADMHISPELLREISDRLVAGPITGGVIPFEYRYYGRSLLGSLYPAQLRLFTKDQVRVTQTDHTQVFSVDGLVHRFQHPLVHDDRKSLERWVKSQLEYQRQNETELSNGGRKRMRDYLRKLGVMPPLMGLLAYLRAGGPLKGAAAARYAYERMATESILAIRLMNRRMNRNGKE